MKENGRWTTQPTTKREWRKGSEKEERRLKQGPQVRVINAETGCRAERGVI